MSGKRRASASVTIIDIAREAGVSKSTVSLVLKGSSLVADDTRDRVSKAMAKLGYVYNRGAANLRGAQSSIVGMVINDLANPFQFGSLTLNNSGTGAITIAGNPFTGIASVYPFRNFNAAVKTDGTVWVWGDCTRGITGDGTVGAVSAVGKLTTEVTGSVDAGIPRTWRQRHV